MSGTPLEELRVPRRRVLAAAGGGAVLLASPWQALAQTAPPGGTLNFQLVRKGDVIGHQSVTFVQSDDRLKVHITVEVKVKMAMLTLFSLNHAETETWQGGQIVSFAATTRKNGSDFYAQGWRTGDSFMARGTKHPDSYVAPPNALPTSQWNHAMLDGPMINTEDGRLMHPTVTSLGWVDLPLASGATVRARHYKAAGDLHFDTYFDADWVWQGLSFRAGDGSLVSYQRL